jgi:ATP-dependent Clp protease adapter protein ClpS
VRQGGALLATLFNLVLHRAIQDIQIQGTVVNWMTYLFDSADNITLMSHSTAAVRMLFQALEKEARALALQIN